MEPLKNFFSESYKKELSTCLPLPSKVGKQIKFFSHPQPYPASDSYRDRVHATADQLFGVYQNDFKTYHSLLMPWLRKAVDKTDKPHAFFWEPLSQVVQKYGQDHWSESMELLALLTQLFTGEFAIRPFIESQQEKTMAQMVVWSKSDNHHLRRLSSEGCRPRLPWGRNLKCMVESPQIASDILNNLKADPSLYVRKSVANHLNDQSWINPTFFYNTIHSWNSQNPTQETEWIIRHALRSEIKKGAPKALALLGYQPYRQTSKISLLESPKLGGSLKLKLELQNLEATAHSTMIDFKFVLPGKNKDRKKVFKGWDKVIPEKKVLTLEKTFPLKDNSVRKYYPGAYSVQTLINGVAGDKISFVL